MQLEYVEQSIRLVAAVSNSLSLIDQVNSERAVIEGWTFGGGTAMMLQIEHRESHDIDFFRAIRPRDGFDTLEPHQGETSDSMNCR